ncbi:MAG: DUF4349 domain-containing protein [Ruminococcus sp.]|nr:DUF4349 domain-containing protein [Ruminococcus sp.]
MKKIIAALAMAGVCLLSSCGDSAKMSNAFKSDTAQNVNGDYSADYYESPEEAAAEAESSDNSGDTAEPMSYKQSDVKAINPQMLVYSCDMSIDVLEFEQALDRFHGLIDKYKGFIESETYSDGGSSSQWKYTDDKKWKTLNAVIRIPSADYDAFCSDAEEIGDMRRKNASVQNLTTEYSDLKTTLSIYEAKEKRYLDLLKDITDEKEAISVESELTNIQIEIAKLKTRMNNIENDVAYSYINLTLNEVREYTAEPVVEKTDTFGQRLKNTVARTWNGFLGFLERLLFFIIEIFPYLIVFGIIIFIVVKLKKLFSKSNAKKKLPAVEPAGLKPEAENTQAEEKAVQEEIKEDTENKE